MPEKMNAEIREAWATALESGEFKQGKGTLTRVDYDDSEKDCCLGVLCKLAVKAGIITRQVGIAGRVLYDYDEDSSVLPAAVMDWAGLTHHNPNVIDAGGRRHSVAEFNDADEDPDSYVTHHTFPEIAKLIREQL